MANLSHWVRGSNGFGGRDRRWCGGCVGHPRPVSSQNWAYLHISLARSPYPPTPNGGGVLNGLWAVRFLHGSRAHGGKFRGFTELFGLWRQVKVGSGSGDHFYRVSLERRVGLWAGTQRLKTSRWEFRGLPRISGSCLVTNSVMSFRSSGLRSAVWSSRLGHGQGNRVALGRLAPGARMYSA